MRRRPEYGCSTWVLLEWPRTLRVGRWERNATPSPVVAGDRRPQPLFDPRGSCRQHHQPVEAHGDPACRGHLRKGGKEVLIDRIALAIGPLPFRHCLVETNALLGGFW